MDTGKETVSPAVPEDRNRVTFTKEELLDYIYEQDYRVRKEDEGITLQEYVSAVKNKTGENITRNVAGRHLANLVEQGKLKTEEVYDPIRGRRTKIYLPQ
jgi:hypothetical protein